MTEPQSLLPADKSPLSAGKSGTAFKLGLLNLLLFVGLLALIWVPEISHFYVRNEEIAAKTIEEGKARPSDAVLEEIRAHRTAARDWTDDAQIIECAEKLLKGRAEVPTFAPIEIHLPFDPADLERGASVWQLQFAGLVVPEVLLDAHRITGREEFYVLARDVILAWARYERSAWIDRGFLWNDHAIADRARTIADFWRVYRRRGDYRPDIAAEIWEFAARTAAFLAKPDQFNFATNHGVMQNVGLMQLCIAFPGLPHAGEYAQAALSRLKDEMGFYVGPEGVVLEHSAEYDEYGLFLFGVALRDATLLQLDVPPDWAAKYEAAKGFYSEIRRPDGTLSTFGDTTIGHRSKELPTARTDAHGHVGPLTRQKLERSVDVVSLYPVEGYVVAWDGKGDESSPDSFQTVLSWSYFPGHGHKHADEPSVGLWGLGHEWWTGAGYWPYDDANRVRAQCWEGANAPHLADEDCEETRTTSLVSYANAGGWLAAETERRGPGTLVIRRLIIHSPSLVWIVVDECSGVAGRTLETIWTTAPEIRIQQGSKPGTFDLAGNDRQGMLHTYWFGGASSSWKSVRGNRHPFAGWITVEGKIQPTEALVMEETSDNAWAMAVWTWDRDTGPVASSNDAVQIAHWTDSRDWAVTVPNKAGSEMVSRRGDSISVAQTARSKQSATLQELELKPPGPEVNTAIAAIHANYDAAAEKYPRIKELYSYRVKASRLCLAILLVQELFFLVFRRLEGRYVVTLRALALCAWVALAVWVPFFYLSTTQPG